MSEVRHEVFRGHLEECLRHFSTSLTSRIPKSSKGAALAKKPIAEFCGVRINTVIRWLYSPGALPVGDTIIKLMCWLDMVGYRVIELERMPKVRRNFAELIGFGLLSIREACDLLGYNNTSTLYQVLNGQSGTSDDKERLMWQNWKQRKEELKKKKEQSRGLFGVDVAPEIRSKMELVKPAERQMLTTRPTAIISIMEGLLSLLEEESIEKIPEDHLVEFQRSAETVLRLSAHLSTLSSRLIMSQERKGGD